MGGGEERVCGSAGCGGDAVALRRLGCAAVAKEDGEKEGKKVADKRIHGSWRAENGL